MNALLQSALNVVVAGGGGIGAAVAHRLLGHYPVEHLFLLQRSARSEIEDSRCTVLNVDATKPATIAAAGSAIAKSCDTLHLVFNAVGVLHTDTFKPERRLLDVTPEALHYLATVNAYFLPQLASTLSPLLRHGASSMLASLSARVGSIADNELGGWYSYRASKAAHNMLLKTISREWRVSHKRCTVIAMHPGTVKTGLSEAYTPANYKKRVLSPNESAEAMLSVMENLTAEDSGGFYAWDGDRIPW